MPRWRLPRCSLSLLFLSALSAAAPAAAGVVSATRVPRFTPHIVNGVVTGGYPTVGWLAQLDDQGNPTGAGCSGTLIGCQTLLTSAHCVCAQDDPVACQAAGPLAPSNLSVFLQNGGFFRVASVTISPDFGVGELGDIAVIHLRDPVTGIAPTPINTTAKPMKGSSGTVVGYGGIGGSPDSLMGGGIKRVGHVLTGGCPDQLPDDFFLCWFLNLPLSMPGESSSICFGDGPIFVDFGAGDALAGVEWGGSSADCSAPTLSAATDVFSNRSFIQTEAGSDLGSTSCGSLQPVGAPGTSGFSTLGKVEPSKPYAGYSFDVPEGDAELRIALNGEWGSNSDLYVRHGDPPQPSTSTFDCADTNTGPFAACVFDRPAPGTWYALVILVHDVAGAGAFQLTTTLFANAPTDNACAGDCNGDGQVTVDELLSMANVALGKSPASACVPGDANRDGKTGIDEILTAVNNALDGCR